MKHPPAHIVNYDIALYRKNVAFMKFTSEPLLLSTAA